MPNPDWAKDAPPCPPLQAAEHAREARRLAAAGEWKAALIEASYIDNPILQIRVMAELGMGT